MKITCLVRYCLIFLWLFFFSFSFGQGSKLDSLIKKLTVFTELPVSYSNDTSRVQILIAMSKEYRRANKDSLAIKHLKNALNISQRIVFKRGMAVSYDILADIEDRMGNYNAALEHYNNALSINRELNDKIAIPKSFNNIGLIYSNMGIYDKASEYFYQALSLAEETKKKKTIAITNNYLGLLFRHQNKYDESLRYHLKSLDINKELGDKKGISAMYGNIGMVYEAKGMLDTALSYNLRAMKMEEEIGDTKGLASTLHSIGVVYSKLGMLNEALKSFSKALKFAEDISYAKAISGCYKDMGTVYLKQKDFTQAEKMLNLSLAIYKKMGQKSGIKDSYKSLSDYYLAKNDYRKAYEFNNLYTAIKDTLLNEENTKQVAMLQTIYETEKKDKQIKIQNLELAGQQLELHKRQIIIYSSGAGIVLLGLLAFYIYRGYTRKQKANIALSEKNILIEKQKEKIIDSITYAKMIQRSILLDAQEVKKIFPQSFIFLRPKDIVSGDFYWLHQEGDKTVAAVVDCTGHGVPGAFMSMIANMLLNEIVIEKKNFTPSEILSAMHEGVYHLLHQEKKDSSLQDGMDMSLFVIDFKQKTIQFAGAKNSLLLVENETQRVIKADPHSIGGKEGPEAVFDKREFTNHEIPFTHGTSLYMFSDGYADQFGGNPRKRFGSIQLKDLLLKNSHLNLDEQRSELKKTFETWKGDNIQIDDVLVMGIKV